MWSRISISYEISGIWAKLDLDLTASKLAFYTVGRGNLLRSMSPLLLCVEFPPFNYCSVASLQLSLYLAYVCFHQTANCWPSVQLRSKSLARRCRDLSDSLMVYKMGQDTPIIFQSLAKVSLFMNKDWGTVFSSIRFTFLDAFVVTRTLTGNFLNLQHHIQRHIVIFISLLTATCTCSSRPLVCVCVFLQPKPLTTFTRPMVYELFGKGCGE